MQWLEISVETRSETIEAVAEALTCGGFPDLVLEDQGEFETFLEENRAYWDYIDEDLQQHLQGLSQIKLYLEADDEAGLARLEDLLDSLKARKGEAFGSLKLTKKPLAQTNWEESWKDNYPPQVLGEKLVVIPYWLEDYDLGGRLPVILDPGLTFGTGAHPSTQMVMEVMERVLKSGDSCLDLGSGSGILSIAALRLGARSAVGVDIDPKAEDIARENAGYNGFADGNFTALTGNVTEDTALMARLQENRYDIVLVNIVADVIIALAPVLPALLDESSTLILSGILDVRLEDVTAALKNAGLTVTSTRQKEDWRCLTAKKA
jgi:ribosomal protein L11 methyltransferase